VEYLAIQEQEGAEGLVLCRSGDVFLDSQVGEIGFDLGSAHLGRVTHVVEVNVTLDPADVGLLGAIGIVFEADGITDLIQQLFGTMLFHRVCRISKITAARGPDRPLVSKILAIHLTVVGSRYVLSHRSWQQPTKSPFLSQK